MEPISISSALLGVIASITVASGIAINSDDDLYDLGKLFNDYVDKQTELTMTAVQSAFAANVALQPNNLVSVESDFLNIVKSFLDDTFSSHSNNVQIGGFASLDGMTIQGLQPDRYIYLSDDVRLYFPTIRNNYDLRYISLSYSIQTLSAGAWTSNYSNNIYIDNAPLVFKAWTDSDVATLTSFYKDNKLYIGASSDRNYDYTQSSMDVAKLEGYISSWGYTLGTFEFPYSGGYNWDDVENKKEDESVALPVPGDLGDLVGPDVNIWDDDISQPIGGVITVPGIANPPIDITTDDVIPGVTDTDVPSVPGAPVIPPIVPPDIPDIGEGDDGTIGEGDSDSLSPSMSEVSGGLYYYYIGNDVSDSKIDDVIGHATGVVSLSYTPYTWYTDLNITKIPYDKERFNNLINISDNFSVYRINSVAKPVKKVGGFKAFANDFSVNIGEGKPYNYKNETKLYQYPYSFAYVYDGINNPLEIKYHYLKYYYNDVYIKQTVSDKCTYGIFVKGYKGDNEGNLESMVLTSGNELPCTSSTYAQWFATNRNQLAQNIQNIQNANAVQNHGNIQQFEISQDSNTVNGIGQLVGALGSIFSLDFGGAVGNVTSAINTTNTMRSQQAQLNTQLALNKVSEQNAIQSALALNNDMRNSPATLVSHGSNVFYGLVNNNKNLLLIRMGLNEEDYFRIGTYFTMYGYKQNKILDINLRSRKFFNYFKIVSPNIIGANVPSTHLEKIKDIFKNGITLWHYNNSNKVLNYFHSDNYEV